MSKKKKKPTMPPTTPEHKEPETSTFEFDPLGSYKEKDDDKLDINSAKDIVSDENFYAVNIIKKQTNDVSLKEYIQDLSSKLILKDNDEIEKFNHSALYTYRNIAKHLHYLENDKLMLLQNQRMLTLKYHVLKKKINFVQLSVIFVSAFIALVEALQQYITMALFFRTIAPILASTYIGLIVAYARFYKWDELGETLTKINEKLALSINQLRRKIKYAQFHKESLPPPSDKYSDYEEYFKKINDALEESRSDAMIDQIVQLKQEIDLLLDYREKLFYKNKLSHLKLQEVIVEKKLRTIEDFKKECDNTERIHLGSENIDNEKGNENEKNNKQNNKNKITDYSYFCFFPFNLFFSNTGSTLGSTYTDGNKFFKEKLYIQDPKSSSCKNVMGFSRTCLNTDADTDVKNNDDKQKNENDEIVENKYVVPMTKTPKTTETMM